MNDIRQNIARAIWNIRRDDEDRCDMELEDMGPAHSVWHESDAVLSVLREQEPVAYLYEYVSPMDGKTSVWRTVHGEWNGQQAKSSKPLYAAPVPPAEPVVLDADYLADQLSEHARHDTERGEIIFDKWTLRAAVESVIAAAPKRGE